MSRTPFHPQALVEPGATVGTGTRVWAFAHLAPGSRVGHDCNVCDHTFIEGGVRVGDRVTLKSGVYLWSGLEIEDDVFVGPGAVFTNDLRPRSKRYLDQPLKTVLKVGCSVGAGAVILPGLTIGRWAMVGAGAVVTKDVRDFALVMGNPAKQRAWVCRCGDKLPSVAEDRARCRCGRAYRLAAGVCVPWEEAARAS